MVCSWCSSSVSFLARGDSRFCSPRCRLAAHRALPARELREIPRWLRWSATKVPLTADGGAASSTNPATWCDYATAAASTAGVGVGFVLSPTDRIVCVDLDHCLDGRGRPTRWAADLLADIPATYVEVSPSGDGLHVWGFADVAKARKSPGIEVYGSGRYLTVTARRWRHSRSSLAEIGDWIDSLPL